METRLTDSVICGATASQVDMGGERQQVRLTIRADKVHEIEDERRAG